MIPHTQDAAAQQVTGVQILRARPLTHHHWFGIFVERITQSHLLTSHHFSHVIQAQRTLAHLLQPVALGGIQAWAGGAEQVIKLIAPAVWGLRRG